jgi:3-oxoacyl-[acyl-carrier protein] reductase
VDLGLQDTVCVITGSTGGIGRETARLLAGEGAKVVTAGRGGEAPGVGEALHVRVDLGRAGEPERLVREAEARLGRVDVLVNNVGAAKQHSFEEVTEEDWEALWQLNVMSYIRTIRAVLPGMKERGRA